MNSKLLLHRMSKVQIVHMILTCALVYFVKLLTKIVVAPQVDDIEKNAERNLNSFRDIRMSKTLLLGNIKKLVVNVSFMEIHSENWE